MKKIIVEHLKYKYPLAEKLALNDISFEVSEGEFIGVIGRNDSGKSTMCQALVGLVPHFYKGAYGGSVTVCGLNVKESAISDTTTKVGMVFQNPFTQVTGAKPTVYDEIAFGLENLGVPRDEMSGRVEAALDLLGIYHVKDQNPFGLSGGQMQRMAIAGIIAMNPEVIVLDEPTSQLDPSGSEEVFRAIEKLSAGGMAVVMVEHKMEKIAEYCDRIIVLKDGELVDFDVPERIFSRGDIAEIGIEPPVYARVCKTLGHPAPYPVTLEGARVVLCGEQRTDATGDR